MITWDYYDNRGATGVPLDVKDDWIVSRTTRFVTAVKKTKTDAQADVLPKETDKPVKT